MWFLAMLVLYWAGMTALEVKGSLLDLPACRRNLRHARRDVEGFDNQYRPPPPGVRMAGS